MNAVFGFVSLITLVLPVILIIVLIIYVTRIVRRTEQRAEERLRLDKENSALQQQQMQAMTELNNRLTRIENMLKDVE